MTNKSRRNYIRAFSQQVDRKKMYKAKKQWIVAGIGFLVATGISAVGGMNTHADTVANGQHTTTQLNNSKANSSVSQNHTQVASQNSNSISDPVNVSASNLHKQIMANNIQQQPQSNSVNTNVHVQNQNPNAKVGNLGNANLNNHANHSALHQVFQHGLSKLAKLSPEKLDASNNNTSDVVYSVPTGVDATLSNNQTVLNVSGDFSAYQGNHSLGIDGNKTAFGKVTTLNLYDMHLGSQKQKLNASHMFSDMPQLTTVNVKQNVDTSNVSDMSYMFEHDPKLSNINGLSKFNMTGTTSIEGMFNSDKALTDITPLKHWVLTNVSNMSDTFDGTSISDVTPIKDWDTTNVTNMDNMFNNDRSMKNSDISPIIDHWSFKNDEYISNPKTLNSDSAKKSASDMFANTEVYNDQDSQPIIIGKQFDYFKNNQDPQETQNDNVTITLRFVSLSDANVNYDYNSDNSKQKIVDVVHPNSIITVNSDITKSISDNTPTLKKSDNKISEASLDNNSIDKNLINNTIDGVTYSSNSSNYPLEPESSLRPLDQAIYKQIPKGNNIFSIPTLSNQTYTVGTNSDSNNYNIEVMLVPSNVNYGTWGTSPYTYNPNSDGSELNIYPGQISDTSSAGSFEGLSQFLNNISSNDSNERISKSNSEAGLPKVSDIKAIAFHGSVSAPTNATSLFANMTNLTTFDSTNGNLDTSDVSNMSAMLKGDTSLNNITQLSDWNTASVANMANMFSDDKDLLATNSQDLQPLANWNVLNVSNISNMFNGVASVSSSNSDELSSAFNPITHHWAFNTKSNKMASSDVANTGIYANSLVSDKKGKSVESVISNAEPVSQSVNNGAYQYGNVYAFDDTQTYRKIPVEYNFGGKAVVSNSAYNIITANNEAILPATTSKDNPNGYSVVNDAEGNQFKYTIPKQETVPLDNNGKLQIDVDLIVPKSKTNNQYTEELRPDGTLVVSGTLPSDRSLAPVLNSYSNQVQAIDVSNATPTGDLSHVFSGFSNLKDLSGLAALDTANINNLSDAFSGDTSLSDVSPIAQWNVENVTSMNNMFNGDSKLTDASPIINDWFFYKDNDPTTTKMFAGTNTKYSSKDPEITTVGQWKQFKDAPTNSNRINLNLVYNGETLRTYVRDLGNNTSAVIPSTSIPYPSDYGLPAQDITVSDVNGKSDTINIDKVGQDGTATYYYSDNGTLGLYNGTLEDTSDALANSGINLSNVKSIDFHNVSAPSDATSLFANLGIKKFSSDGLDTSNTTNFTDMFANDTNLNDLTPLTHWNVKNASDFAGMFSNDNKLTASDFRPLSNWKFNSDAKVSDGSNGTMLKGTNTNDVWNQRAPFFDKEDNPESYRDTPNIPIKYDDGMYGFATKEPASNQVRTPIQFVTYEQNTDIPQLTSDQVGTTQYVYGTEGTPVDLSTLIGVPEGYYIVPMASTVQNNIKYQTSGNKVGVLPTNMVIDLLNFRSTISKEAHAQVPWLVQKSIENNVSSNLVPAGDELVDSKKQYETGNQTHGIDVLVQPNGHNSKPTPNTNKGNNNKPNNNNNKPNNNTPKSQSDINITLEFLNDGVPLSQTVNIKEQNGTTFDAGKYVPSDYELESESASNKTEMITAKPTNTGSDTVTDYINVVPKGSITITYKDNGQVVGSNSTIIANSGDYGQAIPFSTIGVPDGYKLADIASNNITFDGQHHDMTVVSDNSSSDVTPNNSNTTPSNNNSTTSTPTSDTIPNTTTNNTPTNTSTSDNGSGIINMSPSDNTPVRHHHSHKHATSDNYSDNYAPTYDTSYSGSHHHKSHHYYGGRARRVRSLSALNRIGVGHSAYYNGFKVTRASNRVQYLNVTRTIRMYSNVTLRHKSRFLTASRTRRHPVKVLRVFRTRKGTRYEIKVGRRRYFIARKHTYVAYYHSLRGHHTARVLRAITVFKSKHLTHRAKRLYHGRRVHIKGITRVGHRPVFRIGHNRYVLADRAFLKLI